MIAYNIMINIENNSNVSRTLSVPKEITFKQLHEIICIAFDMDDKNMYKFLFEDIGLTIQDTGSLNRDHIDSRFELVDDYFQRYSRINYVNSFGVLSIKISITDGNKQYPEIMEIKGKYNPGSEINSMEEYLNALSDNPIQNDNLIKVNLRKIQKSLLELFNISYTIENNEIKILREDETLDNYF